MPIFSVPHMHASFVCQCTCMVSREQVALEGLDDRECVGAGRPAKDSLWQDHAAHSAQDCQQVRPSGFSFRLCPTLQYQMLRYSHHLALQSPMRHTTEL